MKKQFLLLFLVNSMLFFAQQKQPKIGLVLSGGGAKGFAHVGVLKEIDKAGCTVMLVSGGYPGSYEKGKKMTGLDKTEDSILFHAGTKENGSDVVTSGGRVIAITSLASTLQEALAKSYDNASKIDFEGKTFRSDIGYEFK